MGGCTKHHIFCAVLYCGVCVCVCVCVGGGGGRGFMKSRLEAIRKVQLMELLLPWTKTLNTSEIIFAVSRFTENNERKMKESVNVFCKNQILHSQLSQSQKLNTICTPRGSHPWLCAVTALLGCHRCGSRIWSREGATSEAKASNLWMGSRACLMALEAFEFLMLKYAFSHILEALSLYFFTSISTPKVDKIEH